MYPACALRSGDRATRAVQCESAIFRTTTGSKSLRSLTGAPVRGYRSLDTPEHPDPLRCNKSWKWWQRRPPFLLEDDLWSRWTLVSRFDRQVAVAGPREPDAGGQPFFIPETRRTFQLPWRRRKRAGKSAKGSILGHFRGLCRTRSF